LFKCGGEERGKTGSRNGWVEKRKKKNETKKKLVSKKKEGGGKMLAKRGKEKEKKTPQGGVGSPCGRQEGKQRGRTSTKVPGSLIINQEGGRGKRMRKDKKETT